MTQLPFASGALPDSGHFIEFCDNPAQFLSRVYRECGEAGEFDMGGIKTVLLVGCDAHEAFFRAPDEQLSAAEAYQMMVPVFGEGVQYGAEPHIERQQLKMQSMGLRQDRMKTYAQIIANEVEQWLSNWDDEGEVDIYEAFTQLTLRTSTHCLMGEDFRNTLTDEFAELYHHLENAVNPSALRDPNAVNSIYQQRDRARARLAELIADRIHQRRNTTEEHNDMLQVYMDAVYEDGSRLSDDEITGMIIWFMFAGHHTSGNTSAWTAVELARHPDYAIQIAAEIDALFAEHAELSRNALKTIPKLERFIKETLRLHPPLVTLTRRVMKEFHYKDYVIKAGDNAMVCPYVAHRLAEYFPDPLAFNPDRKDPDNVFASIPFGGGRRKCVGNAFAILQVKAIFCALLKHYTFETVAPPESYVDVMPSLILRPSEPSLLRYRRRQR